MYKKIKRFCSWCATKMRIFWSWYKSLYRGRAWYTKTLVGFVSLIVMLFLYLGAVDINFLGFSVRVLAISQELMILRQVRHLRFIVQMAN